MSKISTGFLSNINSKIQKELFRKMTANKGDLDSQSVRSVWIKMTSGGVESDSEKTGYGQPTVLCGGELTPELKMKAGLDQLYSPGASINADGEAFRPLAGIESCDSQTDGSYGSLKKVTVKWQCWSMDDLDRLGKHFMTIGKSCMVEWGWSAVAGQILTFGTDELDRAAKEGKRRIFDNNGNYEVVSGVIKNFSWTSNADGGFDCETEVISHGTPMVDAGCANDSSMTVGGGKVESAEAAEALKRLGMNNLKKYLANIKLEVLRHMNPGTAISDPWYWGATVPDADDYEVAGMPVEYRDSAVQLGSLAFVSWGYFEDNILSKYLGRISENNKVKYTFRSIDAIDRDGKIYYESVKCTSHPELMTSDSRICQFPGKGGRENSNFEQFDTQTDKGFKGYIRNIKLNVEFIQSSFENAETIQEGMENIFKGINDITGNIFDFRIMADDCQTTNLRVVDMNVVDNTVQDLLKPENRSSAQTEKYDGLFYFPYWRGDNVLVKGQTLTAKVPNSSMYAAMYGSNKVKVTETEPPLKDDAETEALSSTTKTTITDKILGGFGIPDALGSNYGTKDAKLPGNQSVSVDVAWNIGHSVGGPPVVDGMELEGTMEILSAKEAEAKADSAAAKGDEDDDRWWWEKAWDATTEFLSDAVEYIGDAIDQLYEWGRAALSEYDINEILPAHKIAEMVYKINYEDPEPMVYKTDFMLPLELSMEIDGTGGISPGNAFSTDYIPQQYKPHIKMVVLDEKGTTGPIQTKNGEFMQGAIFMCKSISHSVNADGWTTSFEGMMRISIPPPPK